MIKVIVVPNHHADTTHKSGQRLPQLHQHDLDLRAFDAAANSSQNQVSCLRRSATRPRFCQQGSSNPVLLLAQRRKMIKVVIIPNHHAYTTHLTSNSHNFTSTILTPELSMDQLTAPSIQSSPPTIEHLLRNMVSQVLPSFLHNAQ
jgi:hypothetical protein